MKLFSICECCRRRRVLVKRRTYIVPKLGREPITSKGELCGRCFRRIKRLTI